MKRPKFQVGQHVRIKGLPTPKDVICDTGEIVEVKVRFPRNSNMRCYYYKVLIDGKQGMFKTVMLKQVYSYQSDGKNLELIN